MSKNEQVYFGFYGRRPFKATLIVFFAHNEGGLCSLMWSKLRIDDLT